MILTPMWPSPNGSHSPAYAPDAGYPPNQPHHLSTQPGYGPTQSGHIPQQPRSASMPPGSSYSNPSGIHDVPSQNQPNFSADNSASRGHIHADGASIGYTDPDNWAQLTFSEKYNHVIGNINNDFTQYLKSAEHLVSVHGIPQPAGSFAATIAARYIITKKPFIFPPQDPSIQAVIAQFGTYANDFYNAINDVSVCIDVRDGPDVQTRSSEPVATCFSPHSFMSVSSATVDFPSSSRSIQRRKI